MPRLKARPLGRFDLQRFQGVLSSSQFEDFMRRAREGRRLMRGRTLWNVNSTARGGGVAEMLLPLLSYARGAGIDARWLVLQGDAPFFRVTKRIHNLLHDSAGDGGGLGRAERDAYERVTGAGARELLGRLRSGDAVILHDPQTAGMARALVAAGHPVVWRCHVGVDHPRRHARSAIDFLMPYVSAAAVTVFSRQAFEWRGLKTAQVIEPSIDAFSPKNQQLDHRTVAAVLAAAGVVAGETSAPPRFQRTTGSWSEVRRRARMVESAPLRPRDRVVLQVSRWDALKDPVGVLHGFARHVAPKCDAHLLLAGPAVGLVADDPEDVAVFGAVRDARQALPAEARDRVHLALLPMTDMEENAAVVNALQRHAAVAVQKSLAEGFGLTVVEAMWKGRPVVASRVGGIADQVLDGETGLLVPPRDLEAFGAALRTLLDDPKRAQAMGERARRRVRRQFLAPRHLLQYLDLLERLLG